jgi:hypothetical protein
LAKKCSDRLTPLPLPAAAVAAEAAAVAALLLLVTDAAAAAAALRALMLCTLVESGMSWMRAVPADVTSTSNGSTHSGSPAAAEAGNSRQGTRKICLLLSR